MDDNKDLTSQEMLIEFSKIMTREHEEIVKAVDMSGDLKEMQFEVQALKSSAGTNRWMITAIGAAAISILGWFFIGINTLQTSFAATSAVIQDIGEDLDSHKNHPSLHTNGIADLRDDLNDRFVTTQTQSVTVDQLNRRIAQLEKQLQEITEGYIERANGKTVPNTGHDQ